MARFFCGPDRTPWVSINYSTHASALATFLEAARRDAPGVLYDSLSEDCRRRYAIPGKAEMAVAWERLKQETPGLHLLGYAGVTLVDAAAAHARYTLAVEGYRFAVELVRTSYWNVVYEYDGEQREHGRYVDSLERVLRFTSADDPGLTLTLPDLPLAIDAASVTRVEAGREWKVDRLQRIDADPTPESSRIERSAFEDT